MARKVYYGTCPASPDNSSGVGAGEESSTYHVYIRDIDVSAEGFKLEEGDLLVVFFGVQNKIENPSIALYAADTNEQISVIDDEGKFIKTWDVEVEAVDAWGVGETVIFTYTQRGNEHSDGSYHWALVNGVHASQDVYGDTKLYDLDMTSDDPEEPIFPDWIIGEIGAEETDTTTALAPNMLKKLYRLLAKKDHNTDGLIWTSAGGETEQSLGTLQLTSGGDAVNITYPLDAAIAEAMQRYQPITHTGQLVNNGENSGTGVGEPFITKYITDNLYFNNGGSLKYPYSATIDGTAVDINSSRLVLNDANNKIAIGNDNDPGLAGIVLGKATQVNGNLVVNGTINSTDISSAPNFQEGGTLLRDKYSPQLKVFMTNHVTGTIKVGQTSKATEGGKDTAHIHVNVAKNGWKPLGVVGYNVNYVNGHNSGDALYANVWECYLQLDSSGNPTNTVEYSIYNITNRDIYVQIQIYVLYQKVI